MQQDAATTVNDSKREVFIIWFEAMRLRAAMQKFKLEDLSEQELRAQNHAAVIYK
jgi:hypothetical protein